MAENTDNPQECCQICKAKAIDDEKSQIIVCTATDMHFASYWDYEWVDINEYDKREIKC